MAAGGMLVRTVAVIMAGGRGERFWPRSKASMPKQFLNLWSEGTLLQQAFSRAIRVTGTAGCVYVITGQDYGELVLSQLPELCPKNLIIEPAGRDTAPAVGYAAVYIGRRVPDAVMMVMPSDHVVLDEKRFAETLRYAAGVAQHGDYLVTVGIRPTRPEEGYGYIECGEEAASGEAVATAEVATAGGIPRFRACRVARFTEKPDVDHALQFLRGGRHLWNAGIFVWRIPVIREALRRHAPALDEGLRDIEALLEQLESAYPGGIHVAAARASEVHASDTPAVEEPVRRASIGHCKLEAKLRDRFLTLERKSIDYAVLEKADNILVVPADFGWDDVGTWAALERVFDKDENGNVIKGEAITVEASGNIIENSKGDKLFVAFGVRDLVIVNSDDVVLVTEKRRSGNLKKVTEMLRARKAPQNGERKAREPKERGWKAPRERTGDGG